MNFDVVLMFDPAKINSMTVPNINLKVTQALVPKNFKSI